MDPKADDATDRPADHRLRLADARRAEPRPAPTPLPSASGERSLSPRVEVVAGSGVHLSEETRSLLRIRLRAVALAMSCRFGAFLMRDLWLAGHYLRSVPADLPRRRRGRLPRQLRRPVRPATDRPATTP